MRVIKVRILELFAWCIGLSAAITCMSYVSIIPDTAQGSGFALLLGMTVFVLAQAFAMRECFFALGDHLEYFMSNLIAYGVFAAVSMLVRPLLGSIIHTWLFGIFKVVMFTNADISWLKSSVICHVAMLLIMVIAPIGAKPE